jgi:hypothetical protein
MVRVFMQDVSRTIRRATEASLNKQAAKFIPEIIPVIIGSGIRINWILD